MMRPSDGPARMRPLRWLVPLVLGLAVLASATAGPIERATAGAAAQDEDPQAREVTPLAPEFGGEPTTDGAIERRGFGEVAGSVRGARAARAAAASTEEPTSPVPPMARYEELTLLAPSDDPVLVGFHEAGTRDGLELEPVGPLIVNDNTTRITAPPDDPDGTPYRILHSRGRAAGPTSAVDVVMRDDDPVLAPVSGVVTDVRMYYLGGRHRDLRLELRPDDAPELRVILIHVDEVAVATGDRVEAGRTVLADTARRFPFVSQIDYVTDPERWPHVHIEVKEEGATRPGDG